MRIGRKPRRKQQCLSKASNSIVQCIYIYKLTRRRGSVVRVETWVRPLRAPQRQPPLVICIEDCISLLFRLCSTILNAVDFRNVGAGREAKQTKGGRTRFPQPSNAISMDPAKKRFIQIMSVNETPNEGKDNDQVGRFLVLSIFRCDRRKCWCS